MVTCSFQAVKQYGSIHIYVATYTQGTYTRYKHKVRAYTRARRKDTHKVQKNTGTRYTSREVNEARGPHTCSRPCAFEVKKTKNKRNPTTLITQHEIHRGPATATSSKRRAMKNFPRVSPYLHASIGPGFVEIDLVQLSQSVKTARPKYTCTTLLAARSWAEITRRHSLLIARASFGGRGFSLSQYEQHAAAAATSSSGHHTSSTQKLCCLLS